MDRNIVKYHILEGIESDLVDRLTDLLNNGYYIVKHCNNDINLFKSKNDISAKKTATKIRIGDTVLINPEGAVYNKINSKWKQIK